jgi:DNA-binding Xre family transcriptional regulator
MIELRVQEVARARGVDTIKALSERAKLAYDTASDLWHGRMKRVDLEVFNRVLDCTPSDLRHFTRDAENPEQWQALQIAPV